VSGWLLDTNVLSELRRPRPDARVLSFIASQRLEDLFVSTVTFAEIRFGIEAVADAVRRAELNERLGHRVRPMFEQRVLEVSEDVMLTCVAAHINPPLSDREDAVLGSQRVASPAAGSSIRLWIA
jgi:predicted nucleic acid-binding protein